VTVSASYTLTDTEDKDTKLPLLRRARNKSSTDLEYSPIEKLHFTGSVYFVGKRFDNDYSTFPVERVSLGAYTLVNLAVSYDLTNEIELYGRIDNLFDREYEEVVGFGTLGAAAYGGIRVSF